MCAQSLLAPLRLGSPNGNPAHDGTIITEQPDVMWGTDATRFYTEHDGWCWFFEAIDHHLDEVMGWHTAKLGDRSLSGHSRKPARSDSCGFPSPSTPLGGAGYA